MCSAGVYNTMENIHNTDYVFHARAQSDLKTEILFK